MTSTTDVWGTQAAAWYGQLEVTERQWGAVTTAMLDLAGVQEGDRVLDLACGIGDPALTAAQQVGSTGRVIATDLSPDMLAFAAQRFAAAGLSNVEVHEMDAQRIDLPSASVDVVLCRLGLMFLSDLDSAMAGVHRVLVPGGRFVAAMPWRPGDQAMPRLVQALLDGLGLPKPPPAEPGKPGIFSLANPAFLCGAMERAGFSGIRIEPYTLRQDYLSGEEWIDQVLALNAPLRQALAGIADLSPGRQAAIEAAQQYRAPDGHIRFDAYGYCVRAGR